MSEALAVCAMAAAPPRDRFAAADDEAKLASLHEAQNDHVLVVLKQTQCAALDLSVPARTCFSVSHVAHLLERRHGRVNRLRIFLVSRVAA